MPWLYASFGSWAIVQPPFSFMLFMPSDPSLPEPVSTIPIDFDFLYRAKESNKISTDGVETKSFFDADSNTKLLFLKTRLYPDGMIYTWFGKKFVFSSI